MKILLIGEYSGVSKNLKKGFSKLGHNTTIFTNGDGWKKIATDSEDLCFEYKSNYNLFGKSLRGTWRLKALFQFFNFKWKIRNLQNVFDLVIIINYEFIRLANELSPKLTFSNIKKISKNNAPIFLMACGDEYTYLTEGSKMRYWPHDKTDMSKNRYFKKEYLDLFKILHEHITAIVPGMYEYANAYRICKEARALKIEGTIPFAFDTETITAFNKVTDSKIRIYHGINREDFKGTQIIREALRILKEKYPNEVEIRIEGGMPLEEYIKVLKESNIVIDQCKSYSYGMNAIYSMALGKVVFSGNEPECMKEFGRNDIPIINILPEVNDIVRKLESFIEQPNLIKEYSVKSREFVEDFHNDIMVAKQFIDLTEKYGN